MKKKVISLMLVAAMVVTCLTGCGESKNSDSKEPVQNTEEAEQPSAEAEEEELADATIQVMLMGPGKQKDADKVWAAFNEKLQEYVPNTTVEFTIVPGGEYKDRFNQMLAAGEGTDLAWVGYASPTQDALTADGSLMPLNDLLDNYGQDIKEILGETVLDIGRYSDGENYYLISWQGLFAAKRGYYFPKEFVELVEKSNPDWVKETDDALNDYFVSGADGYDIDKLDKVFEQLGIYLQTLKDNGQIYSGTLDMLGLEQQWNKEGNTPALNGITIARGDETFTVVDSYQTDYFRALCRNYADWYQKGFIRFDIASIERQSLQFMQKDESGALTPNALVMRFHNMFSEQEIETTSNTYGVELVGIELDRQGYLNQGKETSMAIPYCADEPERAMMVLNAIYSQPDLYNILIYGIEGEHYTANNDGTITVADNYNKADSAYGLNKWYIGTCANALVTQKDVPGYYDTLVELEKTAYVNPLLKFSFDPSSVADVVSALSAIDGEYEEMLKYGYAKDWEATLDKWIAERKAAGVEQLIEEYQNQINAYIKENNITSW